MSWDEGVSNHGWALHPRVPHKPKPGGTAARPPPTVTAEVWGERQPRRPIPPGSRGYEGGEKANLGLPPEQTGSCRPFAPGTGPRDNPHLSEEPPPDPPTSDNPPHAGAEGQGLRQPGVVGRGAEPGPPQGEEGGAEWPSPPLF